MFSFAKGKLGKLFKWTLVVCFLVAVSLPQLADWYTSYRLEPLRSKLVSLYTAQKSYYAEHHEYAGSPHLLGIHAPSGAIMRIIRSDANTYLAYATWPKLDKALFINETGKGEVTVGYSPNRNQ